MKSFKAIVLIGALFAVNHTVLSQPIRSTHYDNYMRQYQGREYQIITPDNNINMDWLKGAAAAVYNDGYTQNDDTARVLWLHIANIVNFAAQLPQNRNNLDFKARIWQSLTRSLEQLRNRKNQPQQTFSGPQAVVPMAQSSLDINNILGGSLGADYGEKAREIYNYNYDKATKGGFINLRNSLIKAVDEVNKNIYERAAGRKGEWVAPDPSTIVDLQNSINKLHTALQKYRARDKQ